MKMTGWQTRLTFPVIPKEQWKFPTMPSEPSNDDKDTLEESSLDGEGSLSRKGKEKRSVAVKMKQESMRTARANPRRRSPVYDSSCSRSRSSRNSSNSSSSSSSKRSSRTLNVGVRTPNVVQMEADTPNVATSLQQGVDMNEDEELIYIKSEKPEEIMPAILPDPDNLDFYCRTCNLKKPSRTTYRYHLKHFHKMQLTPLQPPRFPATAAATNKLPNLYDPNFFCHVCKKRYKDIVCYRRHCTNQHGMILNRAITKPDLSIIPDPNDPLHHCKACNRSYENRSVFREHLRRTHKMALEPVCNPANLDRSKGFVCRFCHETFEQGKVYGAHLQAKHQGKLEKK